MALLEIPIRDNVEQLATEQSITLSGAAVRIRCMWMGSSWSIWLLDLAGSPLFGPVQASLGVDLLKGHRHDPRVPQGRLFLYSRSRAELGLENETILVYEE